MLNFMTADVSTFGENIWYLYSSVLNHMTHCDEWFQEMKIVEKLGYVETRDDLAHVVAHTGNVPLTMHDGKMKYLTDVLHVQSIKKNLVAIGQMVEQGLHVKFTLARLFV